MPKIDILDMKGNVVDSAELSDRVFGIEPNKPVVHQVVVAQLANKRQGTKGNGFNVLHPMGYDAYGLPAEQYAIQTGQHPEVTTENNISRYREQLDKIGFSFDWSREVRTCELGYYH